MPKKDFYIKEIWMPKSRALYYYLPVVLHRIRERWKEGCGFKDPPPKTLDMILK
jgi:hypothetical protein